MLTVAGWTGRPLRAVRMDPWEVTLWSYAVLEEKRAMERRAERIDLASLVRLAVLDGRAFDDEARHFQREIARAPGPSAYPAGAVDAAVLAESRARVIAQRQTLQTAQWTRRWPPERT